MGQQVPASFEAGAFPDSCYQTLAQILFRMRHRDSAGFGRVSEMVMAAFDSDQLPVIPRQLVYQIAAFHLLPLYQFSVC